MTTTTKKTASKKPTAKKPMAPSKSTDFKSDAVTKTAAAASKSQPNNPVASLGGAAPAAIVAKPSLVNAPQPVVMGPAIRKKEIIEQVVTRSGLKKRDVKPIIDHLLAVMGEAMANDRELIVPPFGRVKVHKKKDAAKKTIFFAKVHQNMAPSTGTTPTTTDDLDS